MRRMIAALIAGLAFGYSWGYGEGHAGQPSIATRTLDRFGAAKMEKARDAREKVMLDAAKP